MDCSVAGSIPPLHTCKTTITPLKVLVFGPEFNEITRILAENRRKTFSIWLDLPLLEEQ